MFYNTIDLSGEKLKDALDNNLKQEEFVLEVFSRNPLALISPSEMMGIYNKYYGKNVPLTSIRRAMTDLTEKNKLRKTSVMKEGMYGKDEHCWCLRTEDKVQIEWQ